MHPCGWDFISIEDFKVPEQMWEQNLEDYQISDGVYDDSDFQYKTIREVLDGVGPKGFCLEVSGVDNLN